MTISKSELTTTLTNAILCPQEFKYTHFTASDAVKVILKAEHRLGRKFTREEIEGGALKDLLIEDDYKIDKVVSSYLLSTLQSKKI